MVQIVLYGTSSRLRKQALRDPKVTLEELLITGRQLERSHIQARHIEEQVHVVEQDSPVIQALNDRRRSLFRNRRRSVASLMVGRIIDLVPRFLSSRLDEVLL